MTIKDRAEATLLLAAMALPEAVQRRLAGKPVTIDGQTLAADVQLMLRLQKVARMPGAETLPIPAGRVVIDRTTAATGRTQPIGSVRDLPVEGLPARLYTPRGVTGPTGLLVFFHGGGFMYGGLDSHDASCRVLAEGAGCRVLAIDYRLAPEHRFPAAYDDAVTAYRWVAKNADSLGVDVDRIAVGGDSAGGNLAAGVAAAAAREGLPLAFQLLVYPATDSARATRSLELFSEGFYLTKAFMDLANASYLPDPAERLDPRASPFHDDIPDGLAPAYVVTAGFDPLRDEGEAYSRALAAAGVRVELRRFPDQIHGFFNVVGVGRTSRAAVDEIAVALKAGLAPSL
ncbi:alpha/beta hydrolase [Nocardioides sp.]|uniref:alpha/beta hydrolase n=1 Tax=Nocardioides sp. TaxID=35761 RepID=UPI00271BD731|nr:alpha/beta hydrolase [Nocardioides sp.]MDO9454978.1 alpha/beta hydrolase [Nocardioides sp.]